MIPIQRFSEKDRRGERVPNKAVIYTTNKQRDYITFMEQILDVCLDFKNQAGSGYSKILFRAQGASNNWYVTPDKDWVNSLFSCVYESIVSGTKKLEISDGNVSKVILLKEELKIETNRVSDLEGVFFTEKRIVEVLDRLLNSFVDVEVINQIKDDSEEFFNVRKRLLTRESVFLLKSEEIDEYLSKYYGLLMDLVLFYDVFDKKQDRDIIIGELLRLDTVYDEKNDVYQLDFWSPMVLNKLQKINRGIADFYKQITRGDASESTWLQRLYKHIVVIKAQHDLRWYMCGEKKELLHAAIAAYLDNQPTNLNFQITARSLEKYNSFEGIKELRLGEKIIYEYEMIREKVESNFKVAIMGDLNVRPIEELYEYVYKKIKKTSEDFLLEFNIYTKKNMDGINNPHIHFRDIPGKALGNKSELGQVIDANNVVFILDCVELYKSPEPQTESHEFVKYRFIFNQYFENSTGSEQTDICDQNMLEELYEMLTCEQIFDQFGRISKEANGSLLEFCEEKQKAVGEKSTIYVYVSDMQAFDNIYHDDQYYIRTERYNQKEIGIIRYSSETVRGLDLGAKKNRMLVFNIWQFIKNVAINERNLFISFINKSDDAYMDLDQIYIGIDYKDWPNILEVHYWCSETRFEVVAQKFINEVLLRVLNNRDGDMFNQYIRKAMYSFFFSSAKSVNDMLFAHLFMNKQKLLGKVVLAEENDDNKVKENINTRFKFSSKRFYDMIMKNYDMRSNMYAGQIKTSLIIQKKEQKESRIKKDKIYQNVIDACRNLSYEDSYLMKNCEMELYGRY